MKSELDRVPAWCVVRRRRTYLLGAVPLILFLPVLFVAWLWSMVDQSDDTYNAILEALSPSPRA